MMRVLNVMEDGRIAGPQLRMLRVAQCLKNEVFTLVAIPDKGSNEFKLALEEADVPFIQIPLTKLSRNPSEIMKSILRMPFEVLKMKATILEHNIDLVHSSGGAWMFKAIIAARLAKCAAVWHLNDTSSPSPFRLLARLIMKHWVSGVIVAGSRVTEHYLPDYDEAYKDKFNLNSIEAPVDTTRFTPIDTAKHSDTSLQLLTVGNISPVKDYLTVVRAANRLRTHDHIKWRVIGSSYASQDKYRIVLNELMDKLNVTSLDFIGSSNKVVQQLQNCDIYICSSAAEASPTSVWEAMACGLPIVSTDVGCVRDYIVNGDNGFLVTPGDDAAIAKHVLDLANDPVLRKTMGEKNRAIAERAFDISVCSERHKQSYSNSIAMFETKHSKGNRQ